MYKRQPLESGVEHIEWLEPAFNERLRIQGGRMLMPEGPGLGFSLSEEAAGWRVADADIR